MMLRPLPLLLLSSLLLPAAAEEGQSGAVPASCRQAQQQAQGIIATWQHEACGVDAEFAAMELPAPTEEAAAAIPEEEDTEDTVITCGGAMLFDVDNSNIVYIGDVRLRDTRLSLHAAKRLFIRMPKREVDRTQGKAIGTLNNADKAPLRHAATPPSNPHATKPAASLPKHLQKVIIDATEAVADTENNLLLLYTPAGGSPISVVSGGNHITATPSAEHPAHLLADAAGNITIEGVDLLLIRKDEQGQESRLHTQNGSICYSAADRTIALTGQTEFSHPQGELRCERLLLARLQGEHNVKENGDFMQQFASLNITGIASVHAEGQVKAIARREAQEAPSELQGDMLDYQADTGLCTISGEHCLLNAAGQYTLEGAQRLVLTPEGELRAEGQEISGRYSRPSEQKREPLTGTFRTGGLITITPQGDQAILHLPHGLTAEDAEADFHCTGELTLTLLPSEGAAAPQLKDSKLNLALMRFRKVGHATACGKVLAHTYAPATHEETGMLQAERAEFDPVQRMAELFGTGDQALIASYQGNTAEATADGDTPPHLVASADGDCELRGGTIKLCLHDKKNGTMTAHCTRALRLLREQDRLETDGAAEFRSDEGILTTNESFYALLTKAPERADSFFPYSGVREAATDKGGKVESVKGAMQCTGPIRVTLNPNAPQGSMGALQYARAEGNVIVAGKDPSGRLIRAAGDLLTMDAATGEKQLTGSRVSLSDAHNTHTASGKNAAIRLDARNNATISGEHHTTTVNRIREQIEQQKKD